MVDKSLDDLHPDLKSKAIAFFQKCKDSDLNAFPTETFRDPEREDMLHAQGITAATSITCKHCFEIDGKAASKAFDFLIKNLDGTIIANGSDSAYHIAGQIGEALGLHWGGRFRHPDYDHFEIA